MQSFGRIPLSILAVILGTPSLGYEVRTDSPSEAASQRVQLSPEDFASLQRGLLSGPPSPAQFAGKMGELESKVEELENKGSRSLVYFLY